MKPLLRQILSDQKDEKYTLQNKDHVAEENELEQGDVLEGRTQTQPTGMARHIQPILRTDNQQSEAPRGNTR